MHYCAYMWYLGTTLLGSCLPKYFWARYCTVARTMEYMGLICLLLSTTTPWQGDPYPVNNSQVLHFNCTNRCFSHGAEPPSFAATLTSANQIHLHRHHWYAHCRYSLLLPGGLWAGGSTAVLQHHVQWTQYLYLHNANTCTYSCLYLHHAQWAQYFLILAQCKLTSSVTHLHLTSLHCKLQ